MNFKGGPMKKFLVIAVAALFIVGCNTSDKKAETSADSLKAVSTVSKDTTVAKDTTAKKDTTATQAPASKKEPAKK